MKTLGYALLYLAATGLVFAGVESGPKVGDKVAELKVFGVVGSVENKEIDFAAERKAAPTIYLFVQREHLSRPMFRFMKTLDSSVKEIDDKAHVVVIFLGENSDSIKEYLPKLNMSGSFANTSLSVYTGEKSGPNGWGINTDAHLTVTVAHEGKVVANSAFTTVNETDVEKVKESLKKAVKK